MTYEIPVVNDRINYLVAELGDRVKIVRQSNSGDTTWVEITINDSTDVLQLFHAGVHAGAKIPL
jgi:hypothetical protein